VLSELDVTARSWTPEQLDAIARRRGELLLAAGAGSGKTSVLVERFVRTVLEDGVEVTAILAITFTDKAAAELRDRIRERLRDEGADEAARATEGAFISTIHGFCARFLRGHALLAGLDPLFTVLDEPEAQRLAATAFDDALDSLTRDGGEAVELVASYGQGPLRGAILGTYAQLRSQGASEPKLPRLPPAPSLPDAATRLRDAAQGAARELAAIAQPGARVVQALERLERCAEAISKSAAAPPWPAALDELDLPPGNGAALGSDACVAYSEALAGFRRACEHAHAVRAHAVLDSLLDRFGQRYAQLKRRASGLDFEDLELMTRDLLVAHDELRERYRSRFEAIMVDELQDTNAVQLELIESLAHENLFTVGDAQQSIYGFRNADVELFERRGERLQAAGAKAMLQTNFRSRSEILEVVNGAFETELGERFMRLRAGRLLPAAEDPRVELLIAEKGADWAIEGLAAPWRRAEARALAQRVGELLQMGCARARDIVVLTRASTDLRAYERALEERGIPTYLIGGRGYWSHPQVLDLVAYLRALANPRDEEALLTVLASPLLGVSLDALVVLADAARATGRDPWWVLQEPSGRLDELAGDERELLTEFAQWFGGERHISMRAGIEELIERVLTITGYDLEILAMPGGERRLANVRKLMRLGREFESRSGADLRGFLELARGRAGGWVADPREGEAPVEGDALDAVRLMTIHRAKGLEFETVCVADLGRSPWRRSPLLRLARDGRIGLRLGRPGTGKTVATLDYNALAEEQLRREEDEERRLFYVAMTRAKERLILSGAARLDAWPGNGAAGPIGWIARDVVPDIADHLEQGSGLTDSGVAWRLVRPADVSLHAGEAIHAPRRSGVARAKRRAAAPSAAAHAVHGPSSLSYSSLALYGRCGYRFYVERVLGLPAGADRSGPTPEAQRESWDAARPADRGTQVQALLERLDFRAPVRPAPEAIAAAAVQAGLDPSAAQQDVADLVEAFGATELCRRLGRATEVRREERFGFLLGDDLLITGALDVRAREPGRRMLIVDYKSDRLFDRDPAEVVEREYGTQRLVYALAALRAGAEQVEVVHVFLERAHEPVSANFTQAQTARLESALGELARGALESRFVVTDTPHRALCSGCPAEGGLCSWPLEMTRRDAPDRLF
jgi:ATP-dependent exoDNAse (exonuclease V) beta subunit